MGRKCSNCGSSKFDEDEDIVCVECGTVLQAVCQLVSPSVHDDGTRTKVYKDGSTNAASFLPADKKHLSSRKRRPVWEKPMETRLSEISNALNLAASLEREIKEFIFDYVCKDKTIGMRAKRRKDLTIASCIYIVCSQHRYPSSLERVSSNAGVHSSDVNKMVNMIKRALNIVLQPFVAEEYLEVMVDSVGSQYKELAERLLSILREAMSVTSNSPVPLVIGILCITIQCSTKPKVSMTTVLHVILAPLCATWCCPVPNVQRAIRYIVKDLLEIAQKIPWYTPEQIQHLSELQFKEKVRTACSILPEILKYYKIKEGEVFARDRVRCRIDMQLRAREERISAAKRRIQVNHNTTQAEDLDWEDKKIEELLRKGVPEEDILPGNYEYLEENSLIADGSSERTELDNDDIPDDCISEYLKDPKEIEMAAKKARKC